MAPREARRIEIEGDFVNTFLARVSMRGLPQHMAATGQAATVPELAASVPWCGISAGRVGDGQHAAHFERIPAALRRREARIAGDDHPGAVAEALARGLGVG